MLRDFNLTTNEKCNIRILVDRELRGRKWWNKYINTTRWDKQGREKILYATWYAISEYLGYSKPQEFITVSNDTLKKLHLYTKIKDVVMKEVPEIDDVDMNYIVRLLFPGFFKENDQDFIKHLIQNYYGAVLDGTKMFPKHYFDRSLYQHIAVTRAQACLEYMINENYGCLKDAYLDFSSNGIISKLRAANLEGACKQCEYPFPIDYLHDTVVNTPEHTNDYELLYQNLRFKQMSAKNNLEEIECLEKESAVTHPA